MGSMQTIGGSNRRSISRPTAETRSPSHLQSDLHWISSKLLKAPVSLLPANILRIGRRQGGLISSPQPALRGLVFVVGVGCCSSGVVMWVE